MGSQISSALLPPYITGDLVGVLSLFYFFSQACTLRDIVMQGLHEIISNQNDVVKLIITIAIVDTCPDMWPHFRYDSCTDKDKNIVLNMYVPQSYCLVHGCGWFCGEINNNVHRYLNIVQEVKEYDSCRFYPRPVLAIGYCRCLRLCVCVSLCVNHLLVRVITRDSFRLWSPNLDQRCKRPWLRSLLFWGTIDLDLQGQI